jgi:hypothetical protein
MDIEDYIRECAVERNYKREGTSSRAAAYAARYAHGAFAAIRTALRAHGVRAQRRPVWDDRPE